MHPHEHLAIRKKDAKTGREYLSISEWGEHLLSFPLLNKGTAFTEEERDLFGLRGLLPPHVLTIEDQAEREIGNNRNKPSDLQRYIHLSALMDRSETLFYRVLLDNVEELLPIAYTPTVGLACQRFSQIYRRSRGLYLTEKDIDRIGAVFDNWPMREVELIVVTDGERILGLGDLGANGMGIPIGKLALYVVAAGVAPWKVMPVCLDVGTDNQAVRDDPLYLGQVQPRVRGEAYDRLVDAFIGEVKRRYPGCLVQFEDFAHRNSFRLLDRYRERVLSFNDDIQGTGAVAYAGLIASQRVTGLRLEDQRIVVVGGGSAGVGILRQIVTGMRAAGLDEAEAKDRVWVLDSRGLIADRRAGIDRDPRKAEFARRTTDLADSIPLEDVVAAVKPTALIGVTGQSGLFSQTILEAMAAGTERPVVFALSNPTSKSECTPEAVYRHTGGRGLCATGSPFPPFEHDGRTIVPGQGNNVYVFPGVGLGATAVGAAWLPDEVFLRAAETLAAATPEDAIGRGTLYPPMEKIRDVSRAIAVASANALIRRGLGNVEAGESVESAVDAQVWTPEYLPYRKA